MKSKPAHVTVYNDRRYGSPDRLIRKFIKLCKKERICEEYREKEYFKTAAQKRKEKQARSKRRRAREEIKAEKKRLQRLKEFQLWATYVGIA